LTPLDFFLLRACKKTLFIVKMWKIWMSSVTESPELQYANARWETECSLDVCHETNGAPIEIYGAHEKLCEVQCLKKYRFFQYTSQLKAYNVLLYCHLRSDIRCVCVGKFPAFYGTRGLIIVFAKARHWSLSWGKRIRYTPSQST
jgi:hypothetical protein